MQLSLIFHIHWARMREKKRSQFALHGLKSFDDFLHLREMPSITVHNSCQNTFLYLKCASIFVCVELRPNFLFVRFGWFIQGLNRRAQSKREKIATMKIINNENDNHFFMKTFFFCCSMAIRLFRPLLFFPTKIESKNRKLFIFLLNK